MQGLAKRLHRAISLVVTVPGLRIPSALSEYNSPTAIAETRSRNPQVFHARSHQREAVPSRSFLSVDLSVNIIEDDRDRIRAVHETQPVGNVTIQNNIVVNNAIDVDYVEKQTKQQVKPVVVKETDDPKKAGKGGAQAVAVFTGEVKEEKNVKPPKVKKIDEVKQEKAKLEEQAPAVEGGKKKKKLQTEQQMTAPEEAQPQQGEEQPIKKKKQKATGQPTQTEEALPQREE